MNPIKILIPGHFIIGNAVDIAIDAVTQLIEEVRPNKKHLKINIIEDSAFRKTLIDKLKVNGVSKYCNILLSENQNEIGLAYKTADLILFPQNKCKISMLKEALSMKVIPICLEFEGMDEYVDKSCAILIEGKSKAVIRNQIADVLIMLSEDPEVIHLLKLGAIKKYQSAYCWNGSTKKRRSATT